MSEIQTEYKIAHVRIPSLTFMAALQNSMQGLDVVGNAIHAHCELKLREVVGQCTIRKKQQKKVSS